MDLDELGGRGCVDGVQKESGTNEERPRKFCT